MNPEFWQQKWQKPQPGFDQAQPNALLMRYFQRLNVASGSRVFVPLCGKSVDMLWLAEQGYDVVGVELVESAVQQFFDDNALDAVVTKNASNPKLTSYQGEYAGQSIEIWVGDIFELSRAEISDIAAVYDRAALVALPDDGAHSLRKRYVQQVMALTDTAPQLVLNFTLNSEALDEQTRQSRAQSGPPFVISDDRMRAYYQTDYQVTFLTQDSYTPTDTLINQAWLLTDSLIVNR